MTFHDFAVAITSMVIKAGHNSDESHIQRGQHQEFRERRRGKSKDMVVLDVILPNQNVPVVLENFWSFSISKTAFQAFYSQWLTTNYKGTKPLYLGVGIKMFGSLWGQADRGGQRPTLSWPQAATHWTFARCPYQVSLHAG